MIPATQEVSRALRKLKRRRLRRTILLLVVLIVLAAALLVATCFRPMGHMGRAMLPTLADGQTIFVNLLDRSPDREEIILIDRTAPEGGRLVRRVIALPGDEVRITPEGALLLNGEARMTIPAGNRDMPASLLIPDGYLFVLGDNAAEALDSRVAAVGLIPAGEVLGTVW